MPPREGIYGLIAEFNTPSELVYATEQARQAGYRPAPGSKTASTQTAAPARPIPDTRPPQQQSAPYHFSSALPD